MSEFVDFPENEVRPLGEVLSDLYGQVRDFIGSVATEAGVVYQEQQPTSSSQEQPKPAHGPGSSCTATACSACGTGTPQWTTRPGLRS